MLMLDTDTCSYILKRKPPSVLARFDALETRAVCVSEITRAELLFGAERHPTRSGEIRQLVGELLSRLDVLPWRAAEEYARIRTRLERRGEPIGNMDLLIAAHALATDATLITNNRRHFERVEGLRVDSWVDA